MIRLIIDRLASGRLEQIQTEREIYRDEMLRFGDALHAIRLKCHRACAAGSGSALVVQISEIAERALRDQLFGIPYEKPAPEPEPEPEYDGDGSGPMGF